MNSPPAPSSADALLFDLGRVVLDINFDKVMAIWAGMPAARPPTSPAALSSTIISSITRPARSTMRRSFESLRQSLGIGHHRRAVPGRLERDLHRRDARDRAAAGARGKANAALCVLQHQPGPCRAFLASLCRRARPFPRDIFLSSSIGLRKPDAEAYDHVVRAIGVPASRILFFDDSAANIEGARARGLVAIHVTSTDDVARALTALGI